MDEIIKKIKAGELCHCNDESGAGGFWDYAWDNYPFKYAERVYGDLWEVVDTLKINKCIDCK